MSYDAWGTSWGTNSAWGQSWVHGGQPPLIIDGGEGYKRRRKRSDDEEYAEYRAEQARLRTGLESAYEAATGKPLRAAEIQSIRRLPASGYDMQAAIARIRALDAILAGNRDLREAETECQRALLAERDMEDALVILLLH